MGDTDPATDSFVRLCRAFDAVALAQGYGGNVSAKLSAQHMAIKASGFRLSDVTVSSGYTVLDYPAIAKLYSGHPRPQSEAAYQQSITAARISGEQIPSMEAGFHSYLGKFVAHLHPVHLNAILCQKNYAKMLAEIFPDQQSVAVDYATPGHALSVAIKSKVKNQSECVVFLQNHGLIVSSSNATSCIKLARELDRKAELYLKKEINGFEGFTVPALAASGGGWMNRSQAAQEFAASYKRSPQFLFPDAVVFCSQMFSGAGKISATGDGILYNMPKRSAEAINEIICVHLYLLKIAPALGGPRYLSEKESAELLSMESEKHRQRLSGM